MVIGTVNTMTSRDEKRTTPYVTRLMLKRQKEILRVVDL